MLTGACYLAVHQKTSGKGIIRVCAGTYVDYEGMSHLIDLEFDDVYWIPQCPINQLATKLLRKQNMYLYTSTGQ